MNSETQAQINRAAERVVVYGGLGFIGSHLCRALARQGNTVRIFDRAGQTLESVRDINASIEVVSGDISRPNDAIDALSHATVLINLIHTTVPGSSMKDPSYDVISNVAAATRWLERIGNTCLRKIIYFSSGGTVYGMPETIPISEAHPTNPLNSYGITKLAIEKYTAMYADRFGVSYCLARPSNVYGPGQQLHHEQGVIGIMASRALKGETLEVWGEGTDERDYLFIDDLVSAILKLLEYNGPFRVFNISSGKGQTVLDVLAALRSQITPFPEIKRLPPRGFDVPVNILDSTRLREATGWQPIIDLKKGIQRTVESLRSSS